MGQSANNLAKAEKLINSGKIYEALPIVNEAVRKNPSDGLALRLLGDIYLFERNFRLATLFLQQAIEKTTKPDEKMFFDLAQAQHFSHQFENAIENYKLSDPKGKNRVLIQSKILECENGLELKGNPIEVRITNAGEMVNSKSDEFHPLITADYTQMFFSRAIDSRFSIFQSRNNSTWEKSAPVPYPVNSESGEKCAGISPDGKTIYLIRPVNKGDIYFSEFEGDAWSNPKPFPYNSPGEESSVCVSADKKRLFFISSKTGNKDIYSCLKSGKGWSKPVRMARNINSSQDEESPWIDADGKTLYFSSKGHSGMGGFDIFKIELGEPNARPVNIGYPINSASDDLYFMIMSDEKTAFYSSFRDGGFGGQDIYSIRMSISKTPQLQLFKGTVSETTGQPIEASIILMDLETNQVVARLKSNVETGTFVTMLQTGKTYSILFEKEGYLFYSDLINLVDLANADLNRNIKMQKLFPAVNLVLNNIFFDYGKSSLKKESSQELQRILLILRQNPGIKAEISSHMDDSGIEEFNLKLSENRAQAVVDYLVATGIKASRLVAKGYGSSQPIADNKTEKGRIANRRTEFRILNTQ